MQRGRPRKGNPPPEPGLYRFQDMTRNGELYIGKSNNLAARKRQHERDGRIEPGTFQYQLTSEGFTNDELNAAESRQINRHSERGPIANKRRGGGGRPPI